MTAREDIAEAANVVDGIEIHPYFEAVSTPGMGWIELLRTDYPNTLGGEDYWGVVVVLPSDTAAAQRYMDEFRRTLWDALGEAMVVTQIRPEQIPMPDNTIIKSMVIEGHREAEE